MTLRAIESRLEEALLHDGPMQYGLYEHELERHLDDLTASLEADQDDYLFAVTHNRARVAMVLIEQSGQVQFNEHAREKTPRSLACGV